MTWRITSKFHQWESFRKAPHQGIDFGISYGEELRSIQDGTIIKISQGTPLGNGVFVQWEDGKVAIYGHLSRFAKGIKIGDKVETGDLLGYVGSTGRSTGAHLHFAVKENGKFIDPSPYIEHIQNMDNLDKLLALTEKTPVPELKISITDTLLKHSEQFSGFLKMLKANFIYMTDHLFNNTVFLQHFKHFIEFFFW